MSVLDQLNRFNSGYSPPDVGSATPTPPPATPIPETPQQVGGPALPPELAPHVSAAALRMLLQVEPMTDQGLATHILSMRIASQSPDALNWLPPATVLHIATNARLPTDPQSLGDISLAIRGLSNIDPRVSLHLRWDVLPQDYRDALMVQQYGADWKAQNHSVNEMLTNLADLPSGYTNAVMGRVVVIPSDVLDAAKTGDPQATRYMQALYYLLPPHQEGTSTGYYFHGQKSGVVNAVGDVVSLGVQSANMAFDLATSPLAVAGSYAGYIVQHLAGLPSRSAFAGNPNGPSAPGTDPFRAQTWDSLPSPAELFNAAVMPSQPGAGLGSAFLRSIGMDPANPANASGLAVANFAAQWEFFGGLGEVGRGAKLARNTINGYRDLKDAEAAAVQSGDFTTAMQARTGAERLLGSVSNSPIARSVYSYLARTPEEMFTSGRGLGLTNRIYDAVNSGASAAQLSGAFVNLPIETANALTKIRNPTDVGEILTETVRGNMPEDLAPVQARLNQIQAILSSESDVTTALANQSPYMRTVLGHFGILPRTTDDIYALKSERAVLEARLGAKIDMTLEAPPNIPTTSSLYRVLHRAAITPFEQRVASVITGGYPLPVFSKVSSAEAQVADDALRTLRSTQAGLYQQALDMARAAGRAPEPETNILWGYPKDAIAPFRAAIGAVGGHAKGLLDRADAMQASVAKAKEAATKLENAEGRVLRWRRSSGSFGRFWDQVWKQTVYDHTEAGRNAHIPADAKEVGSQRIRQMLNRLDVPTEVRNAAVDAYANAKDSSEVFKAMERIGDAVNTSPLLNPREAGQLQTFFGHRLESQRVTGTVLDRAKLASGGVDVNIRPTIWRPGADGAALSVPGGVEEMLGSFRLPDYESVISGTSYWRRMLSSVGVDVAAPLGEGGLPVSGAAKRSAQFLGRLYKVGAHTLQVSTKAFKGFIILPRSVPVLLGWKGPSSFTLRTVGEEIARLHAYDFPYSLSDPADIASLARRFEDVPGLVSDSPEELLGSIGSSLQKELTRSVRGEYRWSNASTGLPDQGIYDAVSELASMRHTAPDMRMFGQGYDVGNVQRWARSELGRPWREQMAKPIEQWRQTLESQRVPTITSPVATTPQVGETLEYTAGLGLTPSRYRGRVIRLQLDPVTGVDVPIVTDVQKIDANGIAGAIQTGVEEPALDIVKQPALASSAPPSQPVTTAEAMDSFLARRKLEFDQTFGWRDEVARSIGNGHGGSPLDEEAQAELTRLDRKLSDMRSTYDNAYFGDAPKAEVDRIYEEMKATQALRADADAAVGGDRAKVGTPAYSRWVQTQHEMAVREGGTLPVGSVTGWSRAPSMTGTNAIRRFTNWAYENWITSRDIKFARGPAFQATLARETERLSSLGWTGQALETRAHINAATRVRDMMFELGAHGATSHYLRNIFPFGAAWSEILQTWAWKIPAQMYPGIGHLYLAQRIKTLQSLFGALGVDLGANLQTVPYVGGVVRLLTGGPVPVNAQFNPAGLNLVTVGGFAPGLAPLPQMTLNAVVSRTHNPIAKAVDDALSPYGPSPSIGPANLTRLWEGVYGDVPPWAHLSGSAQEYTWQAAIDTGTAEQYRAGRDASGKFFYQTQPKESAYSQDADGQRKFASDYQSWLDRLSSAGERSAKKYALASFVLSAASPTNVYITDPVYQEYGALRKALGNVPGSHEAYFAELEREFPHSQLYGAARSILKPNAPRQAYQANDAKAYRAFLTQLDTGERRAYTAEDYARNGLFLTSYHYLAAQRSQLLDEMSGGKGASGVLSNWFTYQSRLGDIQKSWDDYTAFHKPEWANLQAYWQSLPNDPAHPNTTIAQERLFSLLGTMRDVLPILGQEDGVRPQAYKDFRSLLTQALTKLDTQYGPARSPIEAELTNWFDRSAAPYFNAVDKIYRVIDNTPKTDRGPLYDQIRALADNAKPYTDSAGHVYPTPEAWSYNAKSPEEQRLAQLKWATNKTEWLTDFQRTTIAGTDSPNERAFFDIVNAKQTELAAKQAQTKGLAYSSLISQAEAAQTQQYLDAKAAQLGVTKAWNLSQQAPYERLATLGMFSNDPTFSSVVTDVSKMWDIIAAAGFSPGGTGTVASYYQNIEFAKIASLRVPGSQFDKDMTSLEEATAPAGASLRPGTDMYRAVFFDSWF